jgi:hypothetical protein
MARDGALWEHGGMAIRLFVIRTGFVLLATAACSGAGEGTPAVGTRGTAAEAAGAARDSFAVVACAPAVLRAARDPVSPILHRPAVGDTLRAWNETRLTAPGVVVFRGALLVTVTPEPAGDAEQPAAMRFTAGDTLFLLDYQSEGRWSVRAGERLFTVAEFWDGHLGGAPGQSRPVTDSSAAVAVSLPVYDAWYRVRLPDGRDGWWRRDSAEALRSVEHMQKWGETCGNSTAAASAGPAQPSEYPYDDIRWVDSLVDHGIDFDRATATETLRAGLVCRTFARYLVLEEELRREVGAHVTVRRREHGVGCRDSTAADFVRRNEWAEYFMAMRGDWLFLDSGTGSQRGVFVYDVPSRARIATFVGEIEGWRDSTTLIVWVAAEGWLTREACPKVPEGMVISADSLVAFDLRARTRQPLGRWRCAARE